MKFNELHKLHFNCQKGAYSEITDREIHDSQVTVTSDEESIVVGHFGKKNIRRGNVKGDPDLASKPFRLDQGASFIQIELNLVYPKPEKDELRLYLNRKFKPNPGEIWFVYEKEGHLHLGSRNRVAWRSIGRDDGDDQNYQAIINLEIGSGVITPEFSTISESVRQKRDPSLAKKRFEIANYKCERNQSCRLFASRATSKPFLEAHHFIPLQFQHLFPNTLDRTDNLVALCPFCHRAIHHADVDYTRKIVEIFAINRSSLLEQFGVTKSDIYDFYNCETIITNKN